MTEQEKSVKYTEPHEIEWKFQAKYKDNKSAIFVPYVNARALMEWLDKTFDSWDKTSEWLGMIEHDQEKYDKTTRKTYIKTTRHNIFRCTITAKKDGEIQVVDDMAESSDIEPVKGGSSDAFKRAGTNLGFGRDLYKYPTVRVEISDAGYAGFNNKEAFIYITKLFQAGLVTGEDTLWITMEGNLHLLEYGKPGKQLFVRGSKTIAPTAPGGKTTGKAAPKKSEGLTESFIKDNLFEKTGVLPSAWEDAVMASWLEVDPQVHFGYYIQAYNKNVGSNVWFKLNVGQVKTFLKKISNG